MKWLVESPIRFIALLAELSTRSADHKNNQLPSSVPSHVSSPAAGSPLDFSLSFSPTFGAVQPDMIGSKMVISA